MPEPRQVKIAASILAGDFSDLGGECRAVEAAGADWVHVDVMDGHFVPNLTFGPAICAALRPHIAGVMDTHLMIAPVDPFIEDYAASGTDYLTAHVEAGPHVHRTLQAIRAAGVRPGVAINPGTPVEALGPLLDLVDLVAVMSVNPGFGGQGFLDVTAKIAQLKRMIGDRPVLIEIDGGIDTVSAPRAFRAGGDVLIAGSSIFRGGSVSAPEVYGRNVAALREAAQGAWV